MSDIKVPFSVGLKIAARGVGSVLFKPAYAAIGVAAMLLVLGVLLWLPNFMLLYFTVTGELGFGERILFILEGYNSLFTNYDFIAGATIVLFSILFGINTALLIFSITRSEARLQDSGVAGVTFGAIGAGCAACGTSILSPVLSGLAAGLGLFLVEVVGVVANVVGIGLLLYSIYGLGSNAATLVAKERNRSQIPSSLEAGTSPVVPGSATGEKQDNSQNQQNG